MVSDDLNVLLLSDNPVLKLPFKLLEVCVCCREASEICALRLTIIIRSLPHIVDYILIWIWTDVIQRMVTAATTDGRLGTSCAVRMLHTINDAKICWVGSFHRRLYPSGSSIVIKDWGNIMGVCTTISIRILLAARKLSDFPAGVWQTSDCSIDDRQNGRIND